MYTPDHFAETDPEVIRSLIEGHPLAVLVAATSQGLVANHLPLLQRGDRLIGHVALANDIHRSVPDGTSVLAVFSGPQGYVSPNWYPTKVDTHRAVPTWAYQAVHVHGPIIWRHEAGAKRQAVSLLTSRHERALNGEGGWQMGDAPPDFLEEKISQIVAFEIRIVRTEAKSKLNQNHPDANRQAVGAQFEARGKGELAAAVRRSLEDR